MFASAACSQQNFCLLNFPSPSFHLKTSQTSQLQLSGACMTRTHNHNLLRSVWWSRCMQKQIKFRFLFTLNFVHVVGDREAAEIEENLVGGKRAKQHVSLFVRLRNYIIEKREMSLRLVSVSWLTEVLFDKKLITLNHWFHAKSKHLKMFSSPKIFIQTARSGPKAINCGEQHTTDSSKSGQFHFLDDRRRKKSYADSVE